MAALASQRGHLFCWVPVFLALGIGGYFALSQEPAILIYASLCVVIAALWLVGRRTHENLRPLLVMLALVALGGLLAGARAHQVSEPVLAYRYYGPIQGRIIKVDRSASDAVRLTLDRAVLKNMAPARTPTRVRVSLHGQQGYIEPEPGLTIILTGHLSPPSGPVEPAALIFSTWPGLTVWARLAIPAPRCWRLRRPRRAAPVCACSGGAWIFSSGCRQICRAAPGPLPPQ